MSSFMKSRWILISSTWPTILLCHTNAIINVRGNRLILFVREFKYIKSLPDILHLSTGINGHTLGHQNNYLMCTGAYMVQSGHYDRLEFWLFAPHSPISNPYLVLIEYSDQRHIHTYTHTPDIISLNSIHTLFCVYFVLNIQESVEGGEKHHLAGHTDRVTCAEFCTHYDSTLVTASVDRTYMVSENHYIWIWP